MAFVEKSFDDMKDQFEILQLYNSKDGSKAKSCIRVLCRPNFDKIQTTLAVTIMPQLEQKSVNNVDDSSQALALIKSGLARLARDKNKFD